MVTHIQKTHNAIYCNICKKAVKISHFKTNHHRKKVNDSLVGNKYFISKKENKFCKICDFSVKNIKSHRNTIKHKANLKNIIDSIDKLLNYIISSDNDINEEMINNKLRKFIHLKSKLHKNDLTKHLLNYKKEIDETTKQDDKKFKCDICRVSVNNIKQHNKTRKHLLPIVNCKFIKVEQALAGTCKQYNYSHIESKKPNEFLNDIMEIVKGDIQRNKKFNNIKIQLNLNVQFVKGIKDNQQFANVWLNSGRMESINTKNINTNTIRNMSNVILNRIDNFNQNGSNWVVNHLLDFRIKIAKHNPLKGSSYIELPEKYRNSKFGLINIKNDDKECFKWCIARYFCIEEKKPQRISKLLRNEADKLIFNDISFPMKIKDIDKFEELNNISVNVYCFQEPTHELCPLRTTKNKNEHVVNLLFLTENNNSHYILMKTLSPFVNKQHHGKTFVCPYCLHSFYKEDSLNKHEPECSIHSSSKIVLVDKSIKFENYSKTIIHPFVIYADFESTLNKIHTCQPNPKESYTINIQKHMPNSFCLYTKCIDDKYSKLFKYTGEDASKKFVELITREVKRIYDILNINKPIHLSYALYQEWLKAQLCYVCGKEFNEKDYKVKDHCHITGRYRGAAHNRCNLIIRNPKYVPVFIHNLSKYDAHLFIKELSETDGRINVIPQNTETYISITKTIKVGEYFDKNTKTYKSITRDIRFVDSFRFMSESLDALAASLSDDQFENLKRYFPDDHAFKLLKRKGVYPYSYIDDYKKLDEKRLPKKKHFYNDLKYNHITNDDYNHAQNVWNYFKCKTFKDYHNIYLQTDVLLLADVFENFRKTCMETFKLDPSHYFTAPGLSWDAALKYTKIELDTITDPDVLLFIKKGIRGGISTITKRYAKANNKYMSDYDKTKPSSYIQYLDANNLYGWAMSQLLPTGKLRFLNENEIQQLNIENVSDTSNKGYILEVDLEYPKTLHHYHNDLPLAPEHLKVDKVLKLIPNLNDKEKYIIHIRNLKQCIKLGMKIKRIHRVLEFEQSAWIKSYVDLNTNKRIQAKTEFEKSFYKGLINSIYGKTVESVENRIDLRIVKDDKHFENLVNKPNFETFTIFSKNLIACQMKRIRVFYDKPIYVGMSVLDVSKYFMYDFHYNYIKNKYNDKAKLLMTDTDSLMYHIETDDIYNDMIESINLFDTSNYKSDHIAYSIKNKKIIGKMKDEACGLPIKEFIGLRSKLYAFKTEDDKDTKKLKGITKAVVQQKITFDDYKQSLFNNKIQYKKMHTIQSMGHELYTVEINKKALDSYDDKRHILENNIDTLALGHKNIK